VPFVPEWFSAPTLARLEEEKRQRELLAVPSFDGLMAGEPDALVESFADVPELHDPIRGRVKGARAFQAFASEMTSWLSRNSVSVEDVGHATRNDAASRRSFSASTLRTDESIFLSRSWPTDGPTGGSKSCGRSCALGYNIVRWGKAELPPAAGMSVHMRGQSGKLAAARIYGHAAPSARFCVSNDRRRPAAMAGSPSASVSRGLAAVDVQDLPGDERGSLEVEDPVDDIAHLSKPPERMQRRHSCI